MTRAFLMVLDSFGIGATEDSKDFGDQGSDTLGHIAEACFKGKANQGRFGSLNLPNLNKLGLGKAAELSTNRFPLGFDSSVEPIAAYGCAKELSSAKDTQSGHWEISGVPVLFEWGFFNKKNGSFPRGLLDKLIDRAELPGYLGNCHSSGTLIIDIFGKEHMKTGKPIFYTSSDSVFQVACHEVTFGLTRLYELSRIIREELSSGLYNIARVISRPFVGNNLDGFQRTKNRKDLAIKPPYPTILDKLINEKDGKVISIGKISDIYAQQGITKKVQAFGLNELFDKTIKCIKQAEDYSIVFTNFVDFDSSWGHRRDLVGYAIALEWFDSRLPEIMQLVKDGDILILTADHGCDPTWYGNDHTREHIPILVYGPGIKPSSLGFRDTFADIGQTLASYFGLSAMNYGKSMF